MIRFLILAAIFYVTSSLLGVVGNQTFTSRAAPQHYTLPVASMFVAGALMSTSRRSVYRSSRWRSIRSRSSRTGRSHSSSGGK